MLALITDPKENRVEGRKPVEISQGEHGMAHWHASVKPTVLPASLVKRWLQRDFRNCLLSQRAASSKAWPSLEAATLVTNLERESDSGPTLLSQMDKLSQGHGAEDFNPLPRSSVFPTLLSYQILHRPQWRLTAQG